MYFVRYGSSVETKKFREISSFFSNVVISTYLCVGKYCRILYVLRLAGLSNKCLIHFAALDPKFRKESSCLPSLVGLGELLPNVIPEHDMGFLIKEVKMYIMDDKVSSIEAMNVSKNENYMKIDCDWWVHILKIEDNGVQRYKVLSRLVKALLSVFSGPLVEGTFNIMDDIICDDRSSLTIQNYESSSLIKYYLKSQGRTSTTFVPDYKMRANIFSSWKNYQEGLSQNRDIKSKEKPAPIVEAGTPKLLSSSSITASGVEFTCPTSATSICSSKCLISESTTTFASPVSTLESTSKDSSEPLMSSSTITTSSASTILSTVPIHSTIAVSNKRKATSLLKASKKTCTKPDNSEKITNFF